MNIHKTYVFCFLYSCQSFTGSLDYSKNKYVQSCSSFNFPFPFYSKYQQFITNMELPLFNFLLTTCNQSNYTFNRQHFV